MASGYAFVDLAHLVAADLANPDSLLRPILADRAEDFRADLEGYCLERIAGGARTENPPYGDDLAFIDDAFSMRELDPGHNLEMCMAALAPEKPVTWSLLLSASLSYRPHRLNVLLGDYHLDASAVLRQGAAVSVGRQALGETPADDRSALEQCTVNLSAQANLDEVIGRDAEIDRLVTILGRKEANNAVLLGEAGVGKTKIIEGLALRIRKGDVHPRLRGKEILQLDLGLLVAGAQYLGQFQERLKLLLQALKAAHGRYLLFIDEIHQLLGLGRTSGAMDAANLLKPALARGELWCIGATTYAEYRLLESDPALRRRFQPVDVPEPSLEQVGEILARVAPGYALHHRVRCSQETLLALARLARRYLGETRSPAREIGLLDEICSAVSKARPTDDTGSTHSWPTVETSHVLRALAEQTGIPVDRVGADRRQALADLEGSLSARVFGQDHILRPVLRKLRRSFAGLNRPGRPRAILFFAGPSGVGKTELAKALAESLFDSSAALVRLDMSEYHAETARNRLIGAEAGYVGYDEGGQLTEAIRRRPYSLLLLDEFEKAHPTVWRLFLQLFDEGRLTDSHGRTVSFAETVIVLTSNVGALVVAKAHELCSRLSELASSEKDAAQLRRRAEEVYDQVIRSVSGMTAAYHDLFGAAGEAILAGRPSPLNPEEITRRALLAVDDFPPELFGRIGQPLVFRCLTKESLRSVLVKLLADLCLRLAAPICPRLPESHAEQRPWLHAREMDGGGVEVVCQPPRTEQPLTAVRLDAEWTESLLERGLDPVFGARALAERFEDEVEAVVAEQLIRSRPEDPRLFDLTGRPHLD
jgi:ATP-dependent Clp protease ATP-binding subunit ClpA